MPRRLGCAAAVIVALTLVGAVRADYEVSPAMPAIEVPDPTPVWPSGRIGPPGSFVREPTPEERRTRLAQAYPSFYVPGTTTEPPAGVFAPAEIPLDGPMIVEPSGPFTPTVLPSGVDGYVPGSYLERDVAADEQSRSTASDRPALQVAPPTLSSFKNGFFQKFSMSGSYIGKGGHDDLAVAESVNYITLAVPAPTVEWPLLMTPGYELRSLDGPTGVTAPPLLHSLYLQFLWVPQITDQIQLILGVQPGIYTSFEEGADLGFRLQQRALVRYQWLPGTLEVIGGIIYLDRDDIRQLPAGGVIWTPTGDWRIEAIFPTPKASRRIGWTATTETWAFVRGEFGGDTWAVAPPVPGADSDRLTFGDLRVSVGLEQKRDGGAGMSAEVGYVFGRDISRASGPSLDLPSSYMLRAIVAF